MRGKLYQKAGSGGIESAGNFSVTVDQYHWKRLKNDDDNDDDYDDDDYDDDDIYTAPSVLILKERIIVRTRIRTQVSSLRADALPT